MPDAALRFHTPPWRLSGTVVGALLNHEPMWAALGDAAFQPPYKAPPAAPVLAVKPRHMLGRSGGCVVVPPDAQGLEVGATLGIVIGRVACRVPVANALQHIAGYVAVAEYGVPLPSHYRPAVRSKARDGFCVIGDTVAADVAQPDTLALQVWIDGALAHDSDTTARERGVARLLADVSDFMTLQPGDLLLLGASHGAPLARVGQRVEVRVAGVGSVTTMLMAGSGQAGPA